MTKKVWRSVRLDPQTVVAIEAVSKKTKRARSATIRRALEVGLARINATRPSLSKSKAMRSQKMLTVEWANFLDRWQWSWFATLTFRYDTHPERADKTFKRWINSLNRQIFGARYAKRSRDGVIWARAVEYQKREVIHFHVLIGRIPGSLSPSYWSRLWTKFAGRAEIAIYDPSKGARFYLSKCILDKGGDLELGGPLQFFDRE